MLEKSSFGDMMDHQKAVRAGLLAAHNKSYNNKKAMDAASDADLQKTQRSMHGQIQRTINRQMVCSIMASCLDESNKSMEQAALRGIIVTKEFKDVSLGKFFDPQWAWEPWKMPGVRLYLTLMHHFENLQEVSNVNLVSSVLEVMEASQTVNVYNIIEMFDKAVDPVAQSFTHVEDFIEYFKASLQYEVVRKKAQLKGRTGRAWRKAYDSLRASISRSKRLSLALVEPTIKLAKAHLREDELQSKDAKTSTAKVAAAAKVAAKEEESEPKRGYHAARKDREKIKKLQAQLAKATGKPAPASPSKPRPGTAPSTPKGPAKQLSVNHPAADVSIAVPRSTSLRSLSMS